MALKKNLRYEILRRDNFACRYCGTRSPSVALEIDHVIPRIHGGTDDAWNLTAACRPCNSEKRDGIPSEEIIAAVRYDELTYQRSRGYAVFPCRWCLKPIQQLPDEDEPIDCASCNAAVCDAYDAGLRVGLAAAEKRSVNAMVQG